MSLFYKPHTFTLQIMAEHTSEDSVQQYPTVVGWIANVRGLIVPKSPDAAFRQTGLDLRRPHKLLTDELTATHLRVGNRVLYAGRTFTIAAPIRIHDARDPADHVSVMLEELDVV